MSKKLRFSEQLFSLGVNYLRFGRDREALRVLGKVARFGELPSEISEKTQVHLAEIYLRWSKYKQARRHLTAALSYQPESARYHHLMATAIDEDTEADIHRALFHYKRSTELDAKQPEVQCDYGLCLIEMGQIREGLKRLERAVEFGPDESKYVRLLAMNLLEADQAEKARQTVLWAMFRNPSDNRLKKIWNDLRFQEARGSQREEALGTTVVRETPPKLLRFAPSKTASRKRVKTSDGTILRFDPPAASPGPHLKDKSKRRQSR